MRIAYERSSISVIFLATGLALSFRIECVSYLPLAEWTVFVPAGWRNEQVPDDERDGVAEFHEGSFSSLRRLLRQAQRSAG